MKIRPLVVLLGLALALPQVAFGQLTVDIHVFDFGFGTQDHLQLNPSIHLGDTVHWIWDSGFHSTTSAAGQAESWDSGTHFPSFTFDHTFTQLGTFNYFCTIHGFDAGGGSVGGMSGSITVTPVPEPSTWGVVTSAILLAFAVLRTNRSLGLIQACLPPQSRDARRVFGPSDQGR